MLQEKERVRDDRAFEGAADVPCMEAALAAAHAVATFVVVAVAVAAFSFLSPSFRPSYYHWREKRMTSVPWCLVIVYSVQW